MMDYIIMMAILIPVSFVFIGVTVLMAESRIGRQIAEFMIPAAGLVVGIAIAAGIADKIL